MAASDHPSSSGQPTRSGLRAECIFEIAPSLRHDPTIGVSIVDEAGRVEFANERAAAIFLNLPASEAIGRKLIELFDEQWADERLELVRTALRRNVPVILRSIRRGVRIQSTLHPVRDDAGEHVLVITVEGESPPAVDPDNALIVESMSTDLGPLETLTDRELEVLALIGQGLSQIEVASELHRSVRTIEKHRQAISTKLGEPSRITLGQIARRAGLTLRQVQSYRQSE